VNKKSNKTAIDKKISIGVKTSELKEDKKVDLDFNILINNAHTNAVKKGFWDNKSEVGTLLMLITSELGEALEAHRTGKLLNREKFLALKGVATKKDRRIFERDFKETFEVEIADVFIRLFDLCGGLDIKDIARCIQLKMEYNEGRERLHGKRY